MSLPKCGLCGSEVTITYSSEFGNWTSHKTHRECNLALCYLTPPEWVKLFPDNSLLDKIRDELWRIQSHYGEMGETPMPEIVTDIESLIYLIP